MHQWPKALGASLRQALTQHPAVENYPSHMPIIHFSNFSSTIILALPVLSPLFSYRYSLSILSFPWRTGTAPVSETRSLEHRTIDTVLKPSIPHYFMCISFKLHVPAVVSSCIASYLHFQRNCCCESRKTILVFWSIIICSLVNRNYSFSGICCLHLQGKDPRRL